MKQVVRHVGTWMILLSLSLTAPFQISGAVRMRLAARTETIHERKPVENGDGMRAMAPLLIDGADVVETASGQAAASPSQGPEISSPSAILMEASTGQVIYEKNADEPRSPASITKIMTLILIFDALESGKIKMTDQVVTSAYAKSMGDSQVFLEEGEVQTVETLIKCIVVASGNDASVAMAEYIAGDEGSLVDKMNERAKQLGMTNTHFEDCCGLTESSAHLTTARDIAVMSRELINCYPQIHNYSTIWMDTITHVTKQGTKEFGLSNTNKLLKMATNFTVTGLKIGSTSIAKYCLSATAEKDGVRLIASIMAAHDYKVRLADAAALLNYGSADHTLAEMKRLSAEHSWIKYISFTRNFGKKAAIYAGLTHAKGNYVGLMDVDLQDPQDLIPGMLDTLREGGYDCVATRRVDRKGEPPIRSFFARAFYKLMRKISDVEIVDGARDFRLMSRRYADSLLELKEYNRFSKGLFFCMLAFIFIVVIVVRTLMFGDPVAGWPSMLCVILLLSGIQLFCLGLLGEYLSKTYLEVKKRPIYLSKESSVERGEEGKRAEM